MKVLITGGTRGLGKEIAKIFNDNNYDVYLNYRSNDVEADKTGKILSLSDLNIIKCDISNELEVMDMFKKIGDVDIVINNAAIALDNDPMLKTADEFISVLKTNLVGTFLVSKYAVKNNVKSIVNISSTNAIDTYYPESMDYDASKAGVISLTHNFAKYNSNIRVNVICPDWIDTEMNKDMDPNYRKTLGSFLNPVDVAWRVYETAIDKNLNDNVIVIGVNNND